MPAATRLSDAIDEYLAVCKAQGQASSTITSRRSTLLGFLAVVGNIYPRSLGTQHVDAFLVKHQNWGASTKKTNILYLSGFQSWLYARKYLPRDVDILEGKRRIKVPRKRHARASADQFEVLLELAPNARDRAIVAMGLYSLCRVSEMVTIQWGDIDLEGGWMQIYRKKTGEPDRLPLSGELHRELALWRNEVCRRLDVIALKPAWYVLCCLQPARSRTAAGTFRPDFQGFRPIPWRPLSHPLERVKPLLAQIGLDQKGTGMHTLRRSGGDALLEVLEDGRHDESAIRVVQSMYGHKNIATTEMYLDRDVDKARRDSLIRGKLLYGDRERADVIPLNKEARGSQGGAAM